MGVFDEVLSSSETIFSNANALDPDFVPKLLPHRENQQKHIATCIKPLFSQRNGRNLIVKGTSGIGKTASVRRVLIDLEEETEKIKPIYLNCWTKNTTYKIITEIAHQLGYKFTHNMSTDEINRKLEELFKVHEGVVFVFDEIDKVDDYDFLYFLLEVATKKAIVMITSDLGWSMELDPRIISRLIPDSITFETYNAEETSNILRERIKYAFYQGVWNENAFTSIASHAAKYKDIRVGIMLLKSAGDAAENASSKQVLITHVEQAITHTDEIKIKASSELTEEEKQILKLCQENTGALLSELCAIYQSGGGEKSDRTFRRKLARLASRELVDLQSIATSQGQGTRVIYKGFAKTLDEFVPADK